MSKFKVGDIVGVSDRGHHWNFAGHGEIVRIDQGWPVVRPIVSTGADGWTGPWCFEPERISLRNAKLVEPPSETEDESVCHEADRLVSSDRGSDYGHPFDDFSRTARMWSAILGTEVKAEDIPLCMIALKLSRETNKHKRDNLVDIAGYAKTLEMVVEEREKRAS